MSQSVQTKHTYKEIKYQYLRAQKLYVTDNCQNWARPLTNGPWINKSSSQIRSDKTHIRNYRSQIVTHHVHKSSWILCARKKETEQIPRFGRVYLPRIFEYFSCIKIKFLNARISGQKTHEKRSLDPILVSLWALSFSSGDDATQATRSVM